ncbi:MAG: AAA family ATPase [Abitibacteriaceae bacterium]|nr:AAA family ATPase [Abditibacteriaceae bacterium]MBV9866734.1 AAA family ATPase [Abditibacteriaceae bacterium]
MKIHQLDIEGFKSLKKVTWNPSDLNVIIGPNGSGKSNLLRILELISVAAKGRLGRYVQRLGGMESLVWDGQLENIIFRVQTTPDDFSSSHHFVYTTKLVRTGLSNFFTIGEESLSLNLFSEADRDKFMSAAQHMTQLVRANRTARIYDEQFNRWNISQEPIDAEETILSQVTGPFANNQRILTFQNYLDEWAIYHDLRADQEAPIRQAPVSRYEKHIAPDGQNLINVLHTLYTSDRDFKRAVNSAMRAAFGDDFNELVFPPAADQRIQLRVSWKTLKREQSATDLSDGTLRFLFLIAVLANPSPSPLIAIDEPETGLHPSMLPIIAEYAVDAAQRTQVIFTTHSDQFLDAFTDTKPTTTVTKWIDGETILKTIDGEELEYWLQEYSLGKLFRSGELENME